jgi:hypothetical protein
LPILRIKFSHARHALVVETDDVVCYWMQVSISSIVRLRIVKARGTKLQQVSPCWTAELYVICPSPCSQRITIPSLFKTRYDLKPGTFLRPLRSSSTWLIWFDMLWIWC